MSDFICPWDAPTWLVYSKDAPSLLYYSYIPIIIISLFFSIFVLIKDKFSIKSKLLFSIATFFSLWILNILIQWSSVIPKVQMFSDKMTSLLEIPIFIFSIYFLYVILDGKKIYFSTKLLFYLIFLPIIIYLPTKFNVQSLSSDCTAILGPLWLYIYYFIEPVLILFATGLFIFEYKKVKEKTDKKIAIISGIGIISLLSVFWFSNVWGEITQSFQFNLIGPIGMVIFISLMSFMIVRFKIFNIRLIGAQVLVVGLVTLIASKLFTAEVGASRIITVVTLGFVSLFGYFLIKSVKKEIETRERIEKLADQLELANERLHILDQQKSQFVSLASHQLRAPLTAIKGYLSMIMEGDYGEVKGETREIIQRVIDSANNLVTIVGDFLDVSRIEQGKMVYDWKDFDLKPLVETVGHELRQMAEKKGLEFVVSIQEGQTYMVHGDMGKLKQVLTNLTDNSIKYTPKGKVWIELSRPTPETVRFEVNDNGIGIAPETLPKLFEKFTRAEGANDVNVIGTGLGLYVAKEMIRAHEGGKIWAESDGKGLGSTFVVELKAL